MSTAADRLEQALADRYRIERELGAGGMATVYLAEDLKHDRKVALKVLKPELAAVLGAERFVVEIKTTAALQHPHILPLFDSGTADGFLFYVMPFIDGETLRDKLNRETQVGIEEAVKITTEVADALDYAHRNGVIHRDIKPENILLHDGRPMVADFGIALAVSAAAGGRMTETGLSLGTPHYMSPEQATADKDITARSDIYSLASVLYEMLTGEPPHMGNSAQQIIMKIIADTPRPVSELRKSVPPNVAAAVGKALEKLPADRFESAKAFAQALADARFMTAHGAAHGGQAASTAQRYAPWGVAAVLAIALVGTALGRREAPAIPSHPATLLVESLGDSVTPRFVAISRDGRDLVIQGVVHGEGRLFHRPLGTLEIRPIPGTEGAGNFVAIRPDRSAIFWSNQELFEVRLDGGSPTRFARVGAQPVGMSWDDRAGLVLGMLALSDPKGLSTVARGDTAVTVITDIQNGPTGPFGMHHDPFILSDGEHAVYTHLVGGRAIGVASLADGTVETWDTSIRPARVIGVARGILFYLGANSGGLTAIAWDDRALRPVGEPIAVPGLPEDVRDVAIADDGTLVVLAASQQEYEAVLVDSTGRTLASFLGENITSFYPRFDPGGTRVVFRSRLEGTDDVRILRLQDGLVQALRFGAGPLPVGWTSADRVYAGNTGRNGRQIVSRPADASDTAVAVFDSSGVLFGSFDVSMDGRTIAVRTADDILLVRMDSARQRQSTVSIGVDGRAPRLSPDGRWLAYTSDESGRYEVYVRSTAGSAVVPVSDRGGGQPVWSPDQKRLYYRSGSQIMAADVEETAGGGITVQRRNAVFNGDILGSESYPSSTYDVDARGRMILARAIGGEPARIIVRTGWIDELKALMAARRQ